MATNEIEDDAVQVDVCKHILLISGDGKTESVSVELLKQQSDYFKALFQSGMKETKEETVHLPSISGKGLCMFNGFLKSNRLETTLLEMLYETLDAALYLQAEKLIILCNNEIISQLSPTNCDEVEDFYIKYSLSEEVLAVQKYRREHIMEYSETVHFLNCDFDQLCSLLGSSFINVPSEVEVWKLMLKWLKSNKEEIDRMCPSKNQEDIIPLYQQLVGVVRFPSIPMTQLTSFVKKQKLDSLDCDVRTMETVLRTYVSDAIKYQTNPGENLSMPLTQTEIRNPVKVMVALGGFTAKEAASSVVQCVDWGPVTAPSNQTTDQINSFTLTQKNKWKLPSQLCENGACVLNNMLYIAGGQTKYQEDGRYTTNKVYRFDPRICSWKELSPMLKTRSLFYLGKAGDRRLYAVSGWEVLHDINGPTPTVEAYDVVQDTWHFVCSLDSAMGEHSGCTLNGELYISGGFKGPYRGHLDKLWKYDEVKDDWLTLAPMVNARSYHAMVATKDSILVTGGVNYIGNDSFEDVKTCELYSPSSNQWAVIHANLHHPASCMSFIYSGDNLYLFGGHSFEEDTDHSCVMTLDCQDWTWTERKLKSRTSYFTAALLDMPRYVL